jgi:hypothetical protein
MHDGVDLAGDEYKIRDIVLEEFKILVAKQVLDVIQASGDKVINYGDLMAFLKQSIAKVRSNKTGPAGDEYPHRFLLDVNF